MRMTCIMLGLTASCLIACQVLAPSAQSIFTSNKAGYSVRYPADWHQLNSGLDTLNIVNFDPSLRVKAVILPPGGAMISLTTAPEGVSSVDEWIREDRKKWAVSTTPAILTLKIDASAVVEVRSEWGEIAERREEISLYLTLSRRPLACRLSYWKGDARSAEYRRLLGEIVSTIRSAGHPGQFE